MKRTALAAIVIAVVLAAASSALEPRVAKLESQVAALTARVTALEAAHATPTAVPTPSPTPTIAPTAVPTPAACGALQARIDATPAGGTLDLTGCTYTAGASIARALTIKSGTIRVPSGTAGLTVRASDVTIDGATITGSQSSTYVESDFGITVAATAAAPVYRLTIRNTTISSFGKAGIWLRYVNGVTVSGNTVRDAVYAGIMVISAVGGNVTGNTVQRIGMLGGLSNNAYGIGVSDQGAPRSSDVVVAGNLVEDVPTWHCLDTHGGLRITFADNTMRRCSRGIFLTSSDVGKATSITVSGNHVLSPSPVTFNLTPITLYAVAGATFTANAIVGWGTASPPAASPWYDYQGLSSGLSASGNVITP